MQGNIEATLKGEDVKKYSPLINSNFIIYSRYDKNGKTYPYEEEEFALRFPLAYSYFCLFKEELVAKKMRYKANPKYWFSLHRSREHSLFEQEKIITPEISLGTNMTIDEEGPTLSFKDFLKELEKSKIELTLAEQREWLQYFESEKEKAQSIQTIITETDAEIDRMVYALYELTEEEIAVVEGK